MSESGKTAYITGEVPPSSELLCNAADELDPKGGASGIGRAIATMLISKGVKVFIADRDTTAAEAFASEVNKKGGGGGGGDRVVSVGQVDVTDWAQQERAFSAAVAEFGRIDYVYPIAGIGERRWTPHHEGRRADAFQKPDLSVLDADLTGVFYTVSLAVQQFRRQEVNTEGFRGKVGCVASVCGFYCAPTLPVYTSAKHGVVGLTRSYGKYLPEEQITMNAVCPNVIRTNISAPAFYDKLEGMGLLTPMDGLIEAFESMLGSNRTSGEIFEVGPNGGYKIKAAPEFLDKESEEVMGLLYERAHPLQSKDGK